MECVALALVFGAELFVHAGYSTDFGCVLAMVFYRTRGSHAVRLPVFSFVSLD